jgi:UDP-glucose 4-epimerase
MNVLITGGAGFIGSHLAGRFLKDGSTVAVIDDLSTGSFHNISPFASSKNFSYTIDSILNVRLIAELVDRADVVFHLAAIVGVRLVVKNPVLTLETNTHGTEIVLKAAAKKGKRVVIASSSEVYGKSAVMPFHEDADLVMGPTRIARWGYACSKMFDEFLALGYARDKELPVTIVRFFNTSGPGQRSRYGMVLPAFVKAALRREPLTVYGTGEQQRCFGYVGDVVEALVRITGSSNTVGEVINIGNDQEVSINHLAEVVKQITNSDAPIVHVPYEQAYGMGFEDVLRRVPSLEKLQRLIGYRPSTPVEEIIRLIAESMSGRLGEPRAA